MCLFKDMMDFQSPAYEQCGAFCPFLLEVLGLAWEPVRTRPLLWEAVLKYTVRPRRGNLEALDIGWGIFLTSLFKEKNLLFVLNKRCRVFIITFYLERTIKVFASHFYGSLSVNSFSDT